MPPACEPSLTSLWREFGAHTPAGRMLRSLYSETQAINYPPLRQTTTRGSSVETKTPSSRPKVSAPRRRTTQVEPLAPIEMVKGRRKAHVIMERMSRDKNTELNPRPPTGTDRELQRLALQEKFQFGKGSCLPQAALPPPVAFSSLDILVLHPLKRNEKPELVKELFSELKATQDQLENWAVNVNQLSFPKNPLVRKRIVDQKRLEELQLQNKITKTINDLKLLIH